MLWGIFCFCISLTFHRLMRFFFLASMSFFFCPIRLHCFYLVESVKISKRWSGVARYSLQAELYTQEKRKKKGSCHHDHFKQHLFASFSLFVLSVWCGNSFFVLSSASRSGRLAGNYRLTIRRTRSRPGDIRNGWHRWCPHAETRCGWIVSCIRAWPQNHPGLLFPRRSFHPYPGRNVYSVKKKYSITQCESILGAHAINPHAQLTLRLSVSSVVETAPEHVLRVL